MKKITYILLLAICSAVVLGSCAKKEPAPVPDDDVIPADNPVDGVTDTDVVPDDTDTEPDDGDELIDNEPDVVDAPDDGYEKPTNFSKAYAAVSELRYSFYNTLSTTLSSVGESSQMFVDIYQAMAGESSFVYVSTCGAASQAIVESALSIGGFGNISFAEYTDSSAVINVSEPAATQFDDSEVYIPGKFTLSFDENADRFEARYTNDDEVSKYFAAQRMENGYIAVYSDNDGWIIRYVLRDNGTGKMIFCKPGTADTLPADENGFENVEYSAFYELTGDRFHSIYGDVEYTYAKITPDSVVG